MIFIQVFILKINYLWIFMIILIKFFINFYSWFSTLFLIKSICKSKNSPSSCKKTWLYMILSSNNSSSNKKLINSLHSNSQFSKWTQIFKNARIHLNNSFIMPNLIMLMKSKPKKWPFLKLKHNLSILNIKNLSNMKKHYLIK